jgi:hypothetical protein
MKIKQIILLCVCSMIPLACMAESKQTRSTQKHEVRIGYGDPMYETMRWKDEPNKLGVPMNVRQNYRYTGHIYGEYMYRINSWLGVGGQLDFGATMFDYNSYQLDAQGNQFLASSQYRYFYDVCLMPSVRFTYFHRDWVNLYSGVQLGVGIHGDYLGRSEVGCACGVTALGVSVGRDHWFCTAEFGGLSNIQSLTAIYLIWTKWFNVSVGYRF